MGDRDIQILHDITNKVDKLQNQHEKMLNGFQDMGKERNSALKEIRALNNKLVFWFRVATVAIVGLLSSTGVAAYLICKHVLCK